MASTSTPENEKSICAHLSIIFLLIDLYVALVSPIKLLVTESVEYGNVSEQKIMLVPKTKLFQRSRTQNEAHIKLFRTSTLNT